MSDDIKDLYARMSIEISEQSLILSQYLEENKLNDNSELNDEKS